MSGLLYADGFFPLCVDSGEVWDGETYFENKPSNSADKLTNVVGPGTLHPIGMTLEEMVKIYWRMKYIKASCSYRINQYYSQDDPPDWGEPLFSPIDIEINGDDYKDELKDEDGEVCNDIQVYNNVGGENTREVTTLVGQEASLVCLKVWALNVNGGTLDGFPWAPELGIYWKPRSGLLCEGEYFPYFRVFSISAIYENTAELNSYAGKVSQGAGYETLTAFPGSSLFGKDLTVFGPPAPSLPPPADGYTYIETLSANVNIEAYKYFTYGGIYDETTGERV